MKHLLLIAGRESSEQRQQPGMRQFAAFEQGGAVADLAFPRQKDQNVAARVQLRQEIHAAHHRFRQFFIFFRRQEVVFDRKHPSLDFNDRRPGKEL